MTPIQEHQAKIDETIRQIEITNSPIRKKQLRVHLKRLRRELCTYNYLKKRSNNEHLREIKPRKN